MKINCTCCREVINLNAKVVLDELNSLYHADCYSEMGFSGNVVEWKDFGTLKNILEKHNL